MIKTKLLMLFMLLMLLINVYSQNYKILYLCGITMDSTNQIKPQFNISNTSGAAVSLSDFEIRYYYTKEGYSAETSSVDFAQVGTANVIRTFKSGYLSITFSSNAGTIANGGTSGEIIVRCNKDDWTNYTQNNDYSFDATKTAYAEWNKVALYKSGTLIWGPVEGTGGAPIPTPTPVPTPTPTVIPPGEYNYADALIKAVEFYDANKCGPSVAVNNVFSWRSACHTSDGSAISKNLTGGFHDAGDHVKFGLPQGFAASVLGWALYEYRSILDAYRITPKLLDTLKYFTDYFLLSHPDANTFYYQVGTGAIDHAYWGSPEVQTGERPVLAAATLSNSCSDITGITAAALALMYLNYKSTDLTYANKCLTAATEIYNIAKQNNSRGTDGESGNYYKSSAHYDDLSWGAIWMYYATGSSTYLDPVMGWQDIAGDYGGSNWTFEWAANWDNITPYVLLKMAQISENSIYKDQSNTRSTGLKATLPGLRQDCPTWTAGVHCVMLPAKQAWVTWPQS